MHMNERDVSFFARMLFHLASCVWGRDNYRSPIVPGRFYVRVVFSNARTTTCVLEIFMRYVRWLIIRNGPGRVEQSPPAGLLVN